MRWGRLLLGLCAATIACGDDSSRADGEGSASATEGDDASGPSGSEADSVDGGCDCDDADPCTDDSCNAGSCTHEPTVTNECRPQIDVDFPPRAATVTGDLGSPMVTVTGTVSSGLGEIESLTLNGDAVTVAGDGSFSHDVPVLVGGNLLIFETADDAGNTRRRVQSLLWSDSYHEPMVPSDDPVPEGLGFWLAQESLDDGDHSMPVDDLATVLELALGAFDTSAFADPNTAIASQAGYDVYLTSLELGSAMVSLQGTSGGIALNAALQDIVGDLRFDCTNFGCELAGGDGTGGLSITAVNVTGTLLLGVDENHQLAATLEGVDAMVNPDDVEIWSDNAWTDILLSVVEIFIHDSLVASLETALEEQVQSNLGPALANGLSALTLATEFSFPNLGNARQTIPVELAADFASTDFNGSSNPPQGGAVVLRAGGYPTLAVTPFDNDGVPSRSGCGTGMQELAIPREAALEIALADDTLNELLFAGWRGGLLEFPLTNDQLSGGIVEDLNVVVSGMLAPTVSDCGEDGMLTATIGDIRIDATLTIQDQPVEFTAFTTLVVRLNIEASETGIALDLADVVRVETELTADDPSIPMESALIDLLEAQLVDGLLGQLGTTGFGAISLPTIDLSGMVGLPPGTAMLTIHVDEVVREGGTSVIVGRF
jgi:Glucodextranase, domain B